MLDKQLNPSLDYFFLSSQSALWFWGFVFFKERMLYFNQLATLYNSLRINTVLGRPQDSQENEALYLQTSCSQVQMLRGNYISTPDEAELCVQVRFISHATLSPRL